MRGKLALAGLFFCALSSVRHSAFAQELVKAEGKTPMSEMGGYVLEFTKKVGPIPKGSEYYYFPESMNEKKAEVAEESFCAVGFDIANAKVANQRMLIKKGRKASVCNGSYYAESSHYIDTSKNCVGTGRSNKYLGKNYYSLGLDIDPSSRGFTGVISTFTCWFKPGDESKITADYIRKITGGAVEVYETLLEVKKDPKKDPKIKPEIPTKQKKSSARFS
jgi:hypothetical protein